MLLSIQLAKLMPARINAALSSTYLRQAEELQVKNIFRRFPSDPDLQAWISDLF